MKKKTNKKYNVDLANLQDKQISHDFAKEMFFDDKALDEKSTRVISLLRLRKSPSITVSASGVSKSHKNKFFSKTRFLSSDPNEFCDRLKVLQQEKQAGKYLAYFMKKSLL